MAVSEDIRADAPMQLWQVYRMPIILGGLSLLFVALSITIFIKSYQDAAPIRFSSDAAVASVSGEASVAEPGILVDIEGAVVSPGLYSLPSGSRVQELLDMAGGLSRTADIEKISKSMNRAAKLTDGAKIYVPTVGEGVTEANAGGTDAKEVNINTASQLDIETLPGVGEITAQKIITGRPYLRIEELVEKNAVSQSLFEKIKDQLVY